MSTRRILTSVAIALVLLAALAFALIGTGPFAHAAAQATLRVCAGDCPYHSVQAAVVAANPGDVIQIASGTYTDTADQVVYITKTLTLRGGFSGDFTAWDPQAYTTTLDAQGQRRVVLIDGTAASGAITVTLDGLQLTGGQWGAVENIVYDSTWSWWKAPAGGGMRVQDAHVFLLNSRLYGNHTGNGIGAGLAQWLGSFTMRDSTVEDNTMTRGAHLRGMFGGGLFLLQTTVDIADSSILNNTASVGPYGTDDAYGGGIYLNHSTATIDRTTIRGNLAASTAQEYGCGGGLAAEWGALSVTDSSFISNTAAVNPYSAGGGACLHPSGTFTLTGNLFQGNLATQAGRNGYGGGIYSTGGPVTIAANTFKGNTACTGGNTCRGGGVALTGSGIVLRGNTLVDNLAGSAGGGGWLEGAVSVTGNLFRHNTAGTTVGVGDGAGLAASGSHSLVRNTFEDNIAGGCGGGVMSYGLALEDGDVIRGNTAYNGGGLCVGGNAASAAYQNVVVLDNRAVVNGSGVYIDRGSASGTLNLRHLTIGRNTGGDGAGVYANTGTAAFANTIIYSQTVGAQSVNANLSFDHTLRYHVLTATVGSVGDVYAVTADPKLASDGYHLLLGSAAIDQGTTTVVTDDVDGSTRPRGAAPDLGAHESPYAPETAEGVQASMQAGTPQWIVTWDPAGHATSMQLQQDYLIPFSYGADSGSPSVPSYSIQNALPTGLQLSSQESTPALAFSKAGSQLTWSSLAPLAPGSTGWAGIIGRSTNLQPGATLDSSGQMAYMLGGTTHTIPLEASTVIPAKPIKPPLLTSPANGEMCLDEDRKLEAKGLTYASWPVKLYENGSLMGSATSDTSGVFTITWTSALTYTNSVNLYAVVCDPAQPSHCSAPSSTVHIDYPQAFWCPQRSYWEGNAGSHHYIFHFINDQGRYATNDFQIAGVYGFAGTQLHLYSCCDRNINPFTVRADGVEYTEPASHSGRMWTFNIGSAHDVMVKSQCQVGGTPPSHGRVLIDPDGFVFDATQGGQYSAVTGMFSPVQAVSGITVTAYVSVTEWNAWVPWPAELYDNQVNPQVTGADGYFAFFTPPGHYYLEASVPSTSAAGAFQPWRSPVVQVITQVVHVNVPLTPVSAGAASVVQLTPYGPEPPVVHVFAGSSVTWLSTLAGGATPAGWQAARANPSLRPLSAPYALTSTAGFDGGMLVPGQSYRRQFDQTGTYTYTDGAGHTGQVVVGTAHYIYLPLLRR